VVRAAAAETSGLSSGASQPPRWHIDVVTGAARAAPVRPIRTTGSTGTTRPAPQALTL